MAKRKNQVVIVTGGGTGIGIGVAAAFAQEGASLVITGRRWEPLQQAKQNLENTYGVQVLPVQADGADERAVKEVVRQAVNAFGRIDVLVNNAQASTSGVPLIEHTTEDFNLAVYSGLYATYFYMRETFPYLKQTKGSIINFGSGAGLFGKAGQSSYAAAKEGIRGLSRVAATEWGEYGINVNVVCPLVMTPGLEQWKQEYPELYRKTIQAIPLQRFGDAQQDIGRVCVFLASDAAAYITGETITMQGGSGLRP